MRNTLAVTLIFCLVGCGGSDSTPSSSTPISVTPTPAPTPAPTPTPTPAPTANVTGSWTSQARSWDFYLEQKGTTLTGRVLGFKNVSYPDVPEVAIVGTITAAGDVNFKTPSFISAIDFSGKLDPSGRRMTGTLFDCVQTCRNFGDVLDKTS